MHLATSIRHSTHDFIKCTVLAKASIASSHLKELENGHCCLIHAGLAPEEQSKRGSQGVAIALSPRGVDSWKAAGSVVHNDLGARVLAVRLLVQDMEQRDIGLFLVSAYAPVGVADSNVWEEFFALTAHATRTAIIGVQLDPGN